MEGLHNETGLVNEMQAGCEEAFTALYRHYSPRIYCNILHMVRDPEISEELVQELFTRIWQKRESIGIGENFTGYMYRIGQNLVYDHFRKLKRDRQLLARFKQLAEESYQHIEEALHRQHSNGLLKKAIDQLSPQQKKVYQLVRVEGCTYKKAAEQLGISPQTVKEYLVATTKSIRTYVLRHVDNRSLFLLLILIDPGTGM